ncbi:dienelactone hydrolase family protein [Pontiellaceae bacterium B12227]|nr:dienelactone hydrolase family protein [Pontiellaceae bacterium B12227]
MKKHILTALAAVVLGSMAGFGRETLPPLKGGSAPQSFTGLWADFDPRAQPLDVEVLKEWEQDGVVLKVLRYRVGVFKGQKAMMAAVYGYPKGGENLPGLVQIHGGGQYADYRAVFTNAKRGYATISIAWAGRINAPDYNVTPDVVKLFWENKTDDPNYKLTTDWGVLDGYHAPCRNKGNQFPSVKAAEWTLDSVESPRNSPWFLCTLGARRALTFMELQPEVDADKLGVYGHSMGGKLTVLTAGSDPRVKAAAPSCGGISDRYNDNRLFRSTLGDDIYLKNISCPIIFLSPANDFHGRINDLPKAVEEVKSDEWRVTCSPHHNHQDTAPYEVATQLWMDQFLKVVFAWPETPETTLKLKTDSGIPSFSVAADDSKPILSVDVFYTQQGQIDGLKDDRKNTIARFWHHVNAVRKGGQWVAQLPLFDVHKPLWVYANVTYPLDEPVSGAGYYYGTYTTDQFNLSSLVQMVMPEQLQSAGVKATLEPSLVIETFTKDWKKEWFTYKPEEWARKTHKIYDPQWAAPDGAKLSLKVRSAKPNKLVVGIDNYAAEVDLSGGTGWQKITLSASDLKNAEKAGMADWNGIKELRLGAVETLRGKETTRRVGAQWKGEPPQFRTLQWIVE